MPNTTLAQSLKQSFADGISPRTRRYGFFPGLYPEMITLETFHSGQQNMVMPQGEMIRFDTAELTEDDFEIHKEDWKKSRKVERSAEWFAANVRKAGTHLGYVDLDMLTALDDEQADDTFNAIHPKSLDVACREGLHYCATCRIGQLEASGFPEGSVKESLRLRLLQSYVAVNDFYRARWASILKDNKAGLGVMEDGEKWVRRNLHEVDPELRNADASRIYGEAGAAATREGMSAIADSIKEAIQPAPPDANLTNILAQLAEGQRQQGAILAQLVANQGTSISQSTTDAKVDKRTREYKESLKGESNDE